MRTFYRRMMKLSEKLVMYNNMLVRVEGTPYAYPVKNEMAHVNYDMIDTVLRYYEKNELFREFVNSDEQKFMWEKCKEVYAIHRTKQNIEEINERNMTAEFRKVIGLVDQPEISMIMDDNKMRYRDMISESKRLQKTEQTG